MSTRKIIAYVVGTAGCVAVGWAVHGLLLTGSCGDIGQPACPPETAGHFGALAGGVGAVVVAVIAGAGPAALGVFLALAVAALSAAVELPPGERAVPILLTVVFGGLVVAPLAVLPFLLRRRRADARLAAVGAEAVGTVTEVHDTGVTINDNPRVRLTVRIRPADGSTAFTADTTLVVSRPAVPRRGHRFAVRFDPADRRRFLLGDALDSDGDRDADPLDRLAKLPAPLGRCADRGRVRHLEAQDHRRPLLTNQGRSHLGTNRRLLVAGMMVT